MKKLLEALRLDPASPVPVYAQIEEQMARLLSSGAFAPGERLPSVRELGVRLRVNPLTVSKAYGRLSDRGLVNTVRGKGVFAAAGDRGLTKREREAILDERIASLLLEAGQLGFTRDEVAKRLSRRKTP